MACTPSGIFPWAVNKMISDSGDIFLIVFMKSTPFPSGRKTSHKTTLGEYSICFTAALQSPACKTSYPSSPKMRANNCLICGSSSMIRTLFIIFSFLLMRAKIGYIFVPKKQIQKRRDIACSRLYSLWKIY